MPPVVPPRWACCTLVCFFTRLTPSTMTFSSFGKTWMILPSRPLDLPAITRTRSPFFTGNLFWAMSEHLRGKRDDSHEPLLAQLPADRAEDAGSAGLAVGPQDDG